MDEKSELWQIEDIPDDNIVYCYVHKTSLSKDKTKPNPKAFRNTPFKDGTDLSTDWSKYSTPQETRDRIGKQKNRKGVFKNPNDYYVVSFNTSDFVSKIPHQKLIHDPIQNQEGLPDNRSHTKIFGEKDVEIRAKMVDAAKWEIKPEDDD